MNTTSRLLLLAKITRPETRNIVRRSRLFDLIDKAVEKPVLWITSPAGSGKTTLVSSYVQERKRPCLWYKCDEGDTDLPGFFHFLTLAAKKAVPRYKKTLPHLTPEYLASVSTFIRRYFEELYNRLAPARSSSSAKRGFGGVIVFDNYQEIPPDSRFHEMFVQALDVIPKGINVVIISRHEPHPQFVRLKANKRMGVIGWNEMRFTLEEVGEAVEKVRRGRCLKLDCPGPATLYERSGGWAAGLQLMIEASGPQREAVKRSRDGTPVYHCIESLAWQEDVFSYFACEVMSLTAPDIYDFLIATSFLPYFTSSMAAGLTGRADSHALLSTLSRQHYFIEWYPGEKPLYQYHPLFREFLEDRAKEKYKSGEILELRRTAAGMLQEEGFLEDALEMYFMCSDFERAIPLMLQGGLKLLGQGRGKAVERWLSLVPVERFSTDPGLLHLAGLAGLPFDPKRAREYLERAFFIYTEREDHPSAIAACGCLLEAIIIEGHSYRLVEDYVETLDRMLLKPSPEAEAAAGNISGAVLFSLAFCNLSSSSLPFWLEKAEAGVTRKGDIAATLKLCNYLMAYYLFKGEFHSITRILNAVKPFRKRVDSSPVLRLLCMLLEAYHAVHVLADAGKGIAISKEAIEYGRHAGVVIYEFWFSYLIIAAAVPAGKQGLAEECLEDMMGKGLAVSPVRFGDLMVLSGGVAMGRRDWGSASEYFQRAIDVFLRTGVQYSEVLYRVYFARALFEFGDEKSAFGQLALASKKGWHGSGRTQYLGLITQAYFYLRGGKQEEGRKALRDAFSLAVSKGLMMAPFWNRDHSALVCAWALEAGIETEFVRQIVTKHRLCPPVGPEFQTDAWPWPIKIYTLGRFEILKDGEPLRFGGKVQKKPVEALKAIISFGGRDVPEELIMDALWPDSDADAAMVSLKTTLHRLRQGLGEENYVLLKNGRLSLSEEHCWVDVLSFQSAIKLAEAKGIEGSGSLVAQKAVQYYHGPFLPEDISQGWSSPMREKARRSFIRVIGIYADARRQAGSPGEAAELYERAVEADELDEEVCMALMECYSGMRRKDRVARTYNRYCAALRARLDVGTSEAIGDLYDKLVKKKK